MEAAAKLGTPIPKLCYLKDINEIAACRVCVVEIEGKDRLVTSCNNVVTEGMVIYTNSPKVRIARRQTVQLILSQHDCKCATCVRSGNCTLQQVANDLNLIDLPFKERFEETPWDKTFPLIRDSRKCIKCMRCIQICDKIQGLNIWDVTSTGSRTTINVNGNKKINEVSCSLCGQCITHCPVGALRERDDTEDVWSAIADKKKVVVAQVAPAVRAAWGEALGLSREEATIGKIMDALKKIGVDYVFDTSFSADLTIMEEGNEFLQRFTKGELNLRPMFTSCCPGWVSFMEKHFPELGENLSTAKSPQQMFGAIAKNYLAPKLGIDRRNFIVVSVMPCVAKKSEAARPEFGKDGDPDVNISITTRELAHMIRFANMNFDELEESDFDRPLGESTGAGVIFGTTGGVIEAAVRTAYEIQTKKTLPKLDFTELRGLAGIRSATIDFDGVPVKIGIAHGLGNARRLVEEIRAGRSPYHAIEIMACPGGCINGGGQPYHRGNEELLKRRAEALYAEDAAKPLRKSHENPDIQALYEEFLGEPCGPLSHELLHTRYYDRKPVVEPKK